MTDTRERYFEDYPPGAAFRYGPIVIEEPDLLEFARRYDPQPMHTDPEWARTGPYGGLIASGWQTVAVTMRLLVERYLPPGGSLGSPGVDQLRWVRPVRPGQRMWVTVDVVEARPSQSKPDRGIIRSAIQVAGEDGEPVMTMTAVNLLRRRPGGDGGSAKR